MKLDKEQIIGNSVCLFTSASNSACEAASLNHLGICLKALVFLRILPKHDVFIRVIFLEHSFLCNCFLFLGILEFFHNQILPSEGLWLIKLSNHTNARCPSIIVRISNSRCFLLHDLMSKNSFQQLLW